MAFKYRREKKEDEILNSYELFRVAQAEKENVQCINFCNEIMTMVFKDRCEYLCLLAEECFTKKTFLKFLAEKMYL